MIDIAAQQQLFVLRKQMMRLQALVLKDHGAEIENEPEDLLTLIRYDFEENAALVKRYFERRTGCKASPVVSRDETESDREPG